MPSTKFLIDLEQIGNGNCTISPKLCAKSKCIVCLLGMQSHALGKNTKKSESTIRSCVRKSHVSVRNVSLIYIETFRSTLFFHEKFF